MAFSDDKDALIALVRQRGCNQAKIINAAADYNDLLMIFFEFASIFDCDQTYLNAVMAIFDDSVRVSNGVYVAKTGALSNPKVIVGGTITDVTIDSGGEAGSVQVFGGTVENIIVKTATKLDSLVISEGANVEKVDVQDTSCINVLLVKACATFNSTLQSIVAGSCINQFGIDADATFGGFTCEINPV